MKPSTILTIAAILITMPTFVPYGRTQAKTDVKAAKHSRFDQFKTLEGEWTAKESGFGPEAETKVTYHVTSGGSAVAETISPGGQEEMITMITRDGSNLALTHYCAVGNQPHMKAPDTDTSNVVAFKFTGAGNMASDQDTHMHNVTYTFVDKDTLKADWTMYVKGKPSATVTFKMKRKKA